MTKRRSLSTPIPIPVFEDSPAMPFPVADEANTYKPAAPQASGTSAVAPQVSPSIPKAIDLPVPTSSSKKFTFTQKVRILDGFQYRGQMKEVPEWVDRNWLAYDGSPPPPYKEGPVVRLPDGSVLRVSDWLVLEEIDGAVAKMRIYTKDQIEHFFTVSPVLPATPAEPTSEPAS